MARERLPEVHANGTIPPVKRTLIFLLGLTLGARALHAQRAPLGLGDKVVVRILRDSVFMTTYVVDERGMITLPLAGDVRVTNIDGARVRDTVRARLAPFMHDEKLVEVIPLRRVRVTGAAKLPGVQFVSLGATVRDAVALANGVSEEGKSSRVVLVRGAEQRVLADWATTETGITVLESGDDIVVSRLSWVARNTNTVLTGTSILLSIIVTLTRR